MAANEFQESSYAIEGKHSSNEKAQMSDTHSKRGGWITFSFITGLSLSHNFIAQKCVCMFVMKIAEKCIWNNICKMLIFLVSVSRVQFNLYETNMSPISGLVFFLEHLRTEPHMPKSRDTDWLDTCRRRMGNELGCISDWKIPFQEHSRYSNSKHSLWFHQSTSNPSSNHCRLHVRLLLCHLDFFFFLFPGNVLNLFCY